jgi:excinuclease ABC subunit C
MSDLRARVDELPTSPGCYLFKDARGKVIYVGKAKNLRARVRQYVNLSDERTMVPFLVDAAADVDVVVTFTEKEALLLENGLIKKHRPRYNVKLRDDANFLHLRIHPKHRWPRYTLVRSIKNDGAKYFGPYASASRARQTQAFLHRAFPLRTCTDAVLRSRSRPCLLHQMGRCVAPCVDGHTTREEYQDLIDGSMELLSGKRHLAMQRLKARMARFADEEQFEKAAKVRDLIFSIESSVERQKVIDTKLTDRDVWGVHREGSQGAIAIVPMRDGAMQEPRSSLVTFVGTLGEVLSTLLVQAYPEGALLPGEVLLPELPEDHEALAELLTERRGAKVKLLAPQRGRKVQQVALAEENARVRFLRETDEAQRHTQAMADLAKALELTEPPRRMECFDNSHLQGTNPVAAMAVFLDGRPARREYRRYKIKQAQGNDDYAMMREVLTRRFTRGMAEGTLPDLLVIDGGKGQLGIAMAVLQDLGLHDQAVCGLAKPRTERKKGDRKSSDKIVLPHRKEPLKLGGGHPALRILQHLRDETHNHVVRYQRQVRQRENLTSVLDEIPGVGPGRRKALLKQLGSVDAVAEAGLAQLGSVRGIGPELAQTIFDALHPEPVEVPDAPPTPPEPEGPMRDDELL